MTKYTFEFIDADPDVPVLSVFHVLLIIFLFSILLSLDTTAITSSKLSGGEWPKPVATASNHLIIRVRMEGTHCIAPRIGDGTNLYKSKTEDNSCPIPPPPLIEWIGLYNQFPNTAAQAITAINVHAFIRLFVMMSSMAVDLWRLTCTSLFGS